MNIFKLTNIINIHLYSNKNYLILIKVLFYFCKKLWYYICFTCSIIFNIFWTAFIDYILNLKYTINNVEYTNYITTQSNTYYNKNAPIDITYELEDPNKIYIKSDNTTISYFSCGVGIVIILASVINYYLTSRYKFYTAGAGVTSTVNLFRR